MEKTERSANVLYGFWPKAAAIIISAALVPVLLLYSLFFFTAYETGMMSSPDMSFADSQLAKNAAYREMWAMLSDYDGFPLLDFERYHLADDSDSSYRFALRKDGETVYDNHGSGDCFIMTYDRSDGISVDSYFTVPITAQDTFFWFQQLFDASRSSYRASLVILPAGALLELVLLIYLAWAAARRRVGEICASWQEKLPFDLYLAADLFLGFCCVSLASEILSFGGDQLLSLAASLLLITAIWVLFLGLWLTLCARIKLGGLFKNTLIYIVLHLCLRAVKAVWRALSSLVRQIPLIWKAALIFWPLVLLAAVLDGPMLVLYIILLFGAVCWFSIQLRLLQKAGRAMAQGDLTVKADTSHMLGALREHGEDLNAISSGMSIAVEQRLRSERLKTELITNVSHDIKTPLTSIISYVDLLQKEHTPEQETEYIAVLARQSKRLKKLTEDLVEFSKASTGNIPCRPSRRNAAELIDQTVGEYADRLAAAGLEPVVTLPDDPILCMADGAMMWRVIDNLLSNACKYAQPGTRLYIGVGSTDDSAVFSFKNISRERLNISADELMERFVRGDTSRSTEGSGLGLNIAASLMKLQGGKLSLSIDGDLFKAELKLPLAGEPENHGVAGLY
jgi:signal transduction histidine kinase